MGSKGVNAMMQDDLTPLSKLLRVSSLRHQVVSHNIANLNTPGFQKKSVVFEECLSGASLKESIEKTSPKIIESQNATQDTLSLEEEMHELNQNSLSHQVYLQAISQKIRGLKGAISGRF
ncbi:MAG: hypothetical protein HUU50_03850 [Candidatus Brocadiae bacterium]|nr:hypothetical protein [Candidatus Brocadiia bacterium]